MFRGFVFLLIFALVISGASPCQAAENAGKNNQEGTEELAKKAQNPVGDLISIPIQNNFNFNYGPKNETQYVGNLQPVIPIEATADWNVITRSIIPFINQPELAPGSGDVFGIGDIQITAFLSPANPGGLIWGLGPILQLPSGTDQSISSGKWAAGPSAAALVIRGHWVVGGIVNYLSSFSGQNDRGAVSEWTMQPLINYNLPGGWYLTSSPFITANMMAENSQRWTVPLGGGVGRIVRLGKLPLNLQVQGFYNVERPDIGPEWSLQFSVQVLLPKSIF